MISSKSRCPNLIAKPLIAIPTLPAPKVTIVFDTLTKLIAPLFQDYLLMIIQNLFHLIFLYAFS